MSHRMFHSSRKRLNSIQGAFLLLERFHLEMGQAYVTDECNIEISDSRESMSFYSIDGNESKVNGATPTFVSQKLRFFREKDSAEFKWQVEDEEINTFKAAKFEVILFSRPDSSEPLVPADEHVTFRITCAALDDIEANRGKGDENPERRDREVVTLISTIGMEQRSSEAVFPWWNKNELPTFSH